MKETPKLQLRLLYKEAEDRSQGLCLVSNVAKHSQQGRDGKFIISRALITFKGYMLW